ncbi:MAG: prolyl oligopeptidase family serine peptidase [Chitinivibrionales bacterium]|nr:prolyl oligopeptidase family serine peptidase [Chitinivibrionales bacterium]MBD3396130.1 prolyl oligopeptidase family serine peptidase [Chitinivibrionales bacterium]
MPNERRRPLMRIGCTPARGILTAALIIIVAVQLSTAEKIRDEIPDNPRKWVETGQSKHQFTWVKYLLFIPKDYGDTEKEYPCILHLHGAGQKGDNVNALRAVGLPAQLAGKKRPDFPFIVISPQLPGPRGFQIPYALDRGLWYYDEFLEQVDRLIDHVVENYAVDESRIYCVGASMGGYGTWKMAVKYPDRFAAIAPLCGEGNPDEVCQVKHIPTWVYHCEGDEVMPVKGSDEMVEALKACGGKVEYVRPDGGDHMKCWSNQFEDLYPWLLTHQKSAAPSAAPSYEPSYEPAPPADVGEDYTE